MPLSRFNGSKLFAGTLATDNAAWLADDDRVTKGYGLTDEVGG